MTSPSVLSEDSDDTYTREHKNRKKSVKANLQRYFEMAGIEQIKEIHDPHDVFKLKDKNGVLLYRRDSFKRLLKNDSLKYHENGMKEVFDEF